MTAQEIINLIQSLSPDELQKVIDYVSNIKRNNFISEEKEEILRRAQEADRGINMSPAFSSVDEALQWLHDPRNG